MLGIVRAGDGWVGINCLTGQHWLDVCAMLGLPEFGDQQYAIMMGGPERAEFFAAAQPWLSERTVDRNRRTQSGTAYSGGAGGRRRHRAGMSAVRQAGILRRCRGRGLVFSTAGPAVSPLARPPATLARAHSGVSGRPREISDPSLPFAGLKVLDLTTFWAGGYLTCYLGAFGADVVKVESIQRPDGFRYSGAYPHEGDDWYERSALWQATNLNKRDITLDLTSQAGRELARRLAAQADVVVENFSPRVVEQFGLDYQSLAALRPRRHRGPHAGIRPRRPVARLRGLGAEH